MIRRSSGLLLVITGICLHCVLPAAAQQVEQPRPWTSADGRQTVVALLVDFDPNAQRVLLRDRWGAEANLAIGQLSAPDRRYLASRLFPDLATPFNRRPGAMQRKAQVTNLPGGESQSSFDGQISINGRRFQFSDPQAFQRMQATLNR